jgi:hypothetical protein
MNKLIFGLFLLFSSCTYTITLVHTQGQATDVVDDTNTPTAHVSPTLNIPVKGVSP